MMGRRRGHGPCGCFGINLEQGSQLFAIFDAITGLALFLAFLVILLIGELGDKHLYPSEKVNFPRPLVITCVFLGYYNATIGIFLYYAAGCRNRLGCILCILLNLPLIPVDLLKIYEVVVVYMLCKEIKHGKTKRIQGKDAEKAKKESTKVGV